MRGFNFRGISFAAMILLAGSLAIGDSDATSQPSYYLSNTPVSTDGSKVSLAAASARAAQASQQYDQAQQDLRYAVAQARHDYATSDDFTSAQRELKDAQKNYDDAQAVVSDTLNKDQQYKDLAAARADIDSQLHGTGAAGQKRLELATRKLSVSSAITAMETKAFADNSQASSAKTRLATAHQVMNDLNRKFDATFTEQPKIVAAKKALEDASVAKAQANAYLNGAIMDRQAAIAEADTGYGSIISNSPASVYNNGMNYGYQYPYGYGLNYGYGYPYLGYGFGYPFPYGTVIITHTGGDTHHGNNGGMNNHMESGGGIVTTPQ